MPLPDPTPRRVSAPADAGVGLCFRPRFPEPWWPPDWWQRNYDEAVLDPDEPEPEPFTERMMRVPPPPT